MQLISWVFRLVGLEIMNKIFIFIPRFIAEAVDISSFGSYLSVIHGSNGDTLVNRTRSIADVFLQLRNFTGNSKTHWYSHVPYQSIHNIFFSIQSDPIEVSISTALETAHAILTNQTELEQQNGVLVAPAQVILMVCQGQRPTQVDFDRAKMLIDGSFRRFPDLHFIFLTNDQRTVHDLMQNRWSEHSRWHDRQYQIIATDSLHIADFHTRINQALDAVPRRIIAQVKPAMNVTTNPWDAVIQPWVRHQQLHHVSKMLLYFWYLTETILKNTLVLIRR